MDVDRHEQLRDRIRGVLVGTAVGDALGRPFEGRSRVPEADLESWVRAGDPLIWTDDTAMTLALARVLRARGVEASLADLGDAFRSTYDAEPGRGYGAGPPRVFAAARRGLAYEDAARALFDGGGSFGNGAAMRAAPAGCVWPGDVARAVGLGRWQALVTHAHPVGRDGAGAVAGLVSALLAAPPGAVLDEVVASAVMAIGAEGLERELDAALLRAVHLDDLAPPSIAAALGHGISALETVPAAVACLRAGASEPVAAVVAAVLLGGDTDTTAAITGALVGAQVGMAAWPAQWLVRLERRDELLAAADGLAELVTI